MIFTYSFQYDDVQITGSADGGKATVGICLDDWALTIELTPEQAGEIRDVLTLLLDATGEEAGDGTTGD